MLLRRARVVLFCFSCLLLAASDYQTLFDQGAALAGQGKYAEAREKYRAALALRPGAPEALNNLAAMCYADRRYEEAWDAASPIWKLNPQMTSAALIAGLSAVQTHRPKDAIAPLAHVLDVSPGNRDALLGLAGAHVALGELSQAAKLYERRTAEAPADATAWYGLAQCRERMAESASRELASMPGGSAYSKRLLGVFLLERGDDQLAQEAFDGAQSAAPPTISAAQQYNLARSLAAQSRDAFQTFVGLAPNSWQAHLFFGDLARQRRDFPGAIHHYEIASKADISNPAPYLGLATVYWEMGNFQRAEELLHQVLRLNPNSLQATFELGNIAVRLRRDADAVPLLETFLRARPNAPEARADLGRAYLHLGQFDKAAEQLKKALPADVQGDIHFQLASALRKLGRNAEADAALMQSNQLREAARRREQKLLENK
jgi:tetratricopeptide (TPR) repeat protein